MRELASRIETHLNDRNNPRWRTYGAPPMAVDSIEPIGDATVSYSRFASSEAGRSVPFVNQRYRVSGTVNSELSVYSVAVCTVNGFVAGIRSTRLEGVR
jgi:hypothetical protein